MRFKKRSSHTGWLFATDPLITSRFHSPWPKCRFELATDDVECFHLELWLQTVSPMSFPELAVRNLDEAASLEALSQREIPLVNKSQRVSIR